MLNFIMFISKGVHSPVLSRALLVLKTEQGLYVLSFGSRKATGIAPARVAKHWPRAGNCLLGHKLNELQFVSFAHILFIQYNF